MFGIWSFLRQFMYTKFIIVDDDDVEHPRLEGVWAPHHPRMDATATTLVEQRPIDYGETASIRVG